MNYVLRKSSVEEAVLEGSTSADSGTGTESTVMSCCSDRAATIATRVLDNVATRTKGTRRERPKSCFDYEDSEA